jgi:glutamate-1-semialdehyde 2,1-aminomutase
MARADSLTFATLASMAPTVTQQWLLLTMAVVLGRVVYLVWRHNFRNSMIWFVKLATDPFTDIVAYYSSAYKLLLPSQARKSGAA